MNGVYTQVIHVCITALDIDICFIVFKSIEGAICATNLNEIKNLELVLINKENSIS